MLKQYIMFCLSCIKTSLLDETSSLSIVRDVTADSWNWQVGVHSWTMFTGLSTLEDDMMKMSKMGQSYSFNMFIELKPCTAQYPSPFECLNTPISTPYWHYYKTNIQIIIYNFMCFSSPDHKLNRTQYSHQHWLAVVLKSDQLVTTWCLPVTKHQ